MPEHLYYIIKINIYYNNAKLISMEMQNALLISVINQIFE